jgi:hypothetical protein
MSDRHLHIVSFAIPYPANYGGVIDVFYKLKALHSQGIRIHLHCFAYRNQPAPELLHYCESVDYYDRQTSFAAALTLKPYIVASRRSSQLLARLLLDDYPILFEGLHSCYYLGHPALRDRTLIYRESNIEHAYYYNLARAEKNIFNSAYFLLASFKLRMFQATLKYATKMLVVSEDDRQYLARKFPDNEVIYLPSFHPSDAVSSLPGRGVYALYHGNLSVPENSKAAEYLVQNVFDSDAYPLIIAGLNPPERLQKLVKDKKHIRLVPNPGNAEMETLVKEAQVNIMVTFQATGLKLKLLQTLYNGRFTLVNPAMLAGTELNELCTITEDADGLKTAIGELFGRTFEVGEIEKREKILAERFSNQRNASRLIDAVFESR